MRYRFFTQISLIVCILSLSGCATTEYTSRIRNEPFHVDNTFRQVPVKQTLSINTTGTIWPGERSGNILFSDQRASRVGDIITVKIIEATKSNEKATTDIKRTGANVSIGLSNFFGLETNKYPSSITPGSLITSNVKNDFKGEGETTRDGSVQAIISAKVVEVMPNGNLAIEGKREITLNNERKEILLQGVIRQKDIAFDNSVASTQIADAKIILTGVGVIGEKQSPGWLARILDLVWPF
ncbi:MAG: flagellar basal body L-ring protein FlgH [Syntrophorhabdaceae bacterium]|nr:flagellar basal body L-ring protein FlgH [Syntrophorhabdaceae bacterium]